MAVKTDMSKAYDRIEWDFLEAILKRMGFSETWITWVLECVTTVSYTFLINGSPQGKVIPTRGLRQGDPLSPYLFILCTEVLSGLCRKAQENKELPGIKVATLSPRVNHLLFADDTMFFVKTNAKSCKALLDILDKYEQASGQSISLNKSSITFSAKTSRTRKNIVKRILKINNEGGTGKYLGLPEHFGRKKRDVFETIIDKIQQKSHSWSSKLLSTAGKQVLLKAVLSSMPSHAMSCFKLPTTLCDRIQSILTRFWWDDDPGERKLAWISWKRLSKPMKAGGLGFRDIMEFNDALLAKIAWRLLKHPDALLSRILKGKYFPEDPFLDSTVPRRASYGWKSIIAGRRVLQSGLGWLVGDGSQIRIWDDSWLSTKEARRPMGPVQEHNQELRVAALIDPVTNQWDTASIQALIPYYETEILAIPRSMIKREDKLVWLATSTGIYSAKTGYGTRAVHSRPDIFSDTNWHSLIWSLKTVPKIRNFLWKASLDALPVGVLLNQRGVAVDPRCVRCGELESIPHVLFHCPFAQQIWKASPICDLDLNPEISVLQFLKQAKSSRNLPPSGLGGGELYPWICWRLWLARNELVFSNKGCSEEDTLLMSFHDAKQWQEAQQSLKPVLQLQNPSPVKLRQHRLGTITGVHGHCRLSIFGARCGSIWIKFALVKAQELRLLELHVRSDSQTLVNLLVNGTEHTEIYGILEDIRDLCSSFNLISFAFVPRNENGLADILSKRALCNLPLSVSTV